MRRRHFQLVGTLIIAIAVLAGLLLLFRPRLAAVENTQTAGLMQAMLVCILCFFILFGAVMVFLESKNVRIAVWRDEQLRIAQEQYRVLKAVSDCGVFRVILPAGTLDVSENVEAALGRKFPTEHFPESLLAAGIIYEDDLPVLSGLSTEALQRVRADGMLSRDIRLVGEDGFPVWYQMRVSSVEDGNHKSVVLLGTLTEINEEKMHQRGAIEKTKRDPMTGLYNKYAMQEQTDACLKESDSEAIHALFILDLDNFRYVNDTYGHFAGDQVLSDLGRKLQRMFRQDDIIARIGGDEFAVLMKNAASYRTVRDKARQVSTVLRTIRINDSTQSMVSASIGVALAPRDGETYISLLEKADAALYYVKDNGKKHYKIYGEAEEERVSGA